MTFTSGDAGFKTSADFTFSVPGVYKRLIAQISDGTTTGCSVDAFAVRPASYALTSSAAPTTKAGASFTITATPQNISNGALTGAHRVSHARQHQGAGGVRHADAVPAILESRGDVRHVHLQRRRHFQLAGQCDLRRAVRQRQRRGAGSDQRRLQSGVGYALRSGDQQHGRFRRQVRLRYRQRRLAQLRALLPRPLRSVAGGDARHARPTDSATWDSRSR